MTMLIPVIENFILFGTLFALGGFLFAWAARVGVLRGLWQPHPETLARLYSFVLVLPPLAAAWLVASALLPEAWLGHATFDSIHTTHHEMHLLGLFTARIEPTLAYATLLFAVAASAYAVWSGGRAHARVGGIIRRLEMNAQPPQIEKVKHVERVAARHDLDVGLVMSDYPLSFVWGYTRSKLLLSSGLLNTLSSEELIGVLEHEAAHHARRDNLVKLLLVCCSRLSLIFPLTRLVLLWRNEQVELICDEVAVAGQASPLDVASAFSGALAGRRASGGRVGLRRRRRPAQLRAAHPPPARARRLFAHEEARRSSVAAARLHDARRAVHLRRHARADLSIHAARRTRGGGINHSTFRLKETLVRL